MSAEEIAELRHMNLGEADRIARKLNLQVLYDRDHQCPDLEDRYIFNSPFRMTLDGHQKQRNEDGELVCTHEDAEVEYDRGGDGITEPGASYSVYCYGCNNEDMSQSQVDALVEAYCDNLADVAGGYDD